MRFKENEDKGFDLQITSMLHKMDSKLSQAISKSNELLKLKNDPTFESDFARIEKKKELIGKISNMQKLMETLKDDLNEPSTQNIYNNLHDQIKILTEQVYNDSSFEKWEYSTENELKQLNGSVSNTRSAVNLLKNQIEHKEYQLRKIMDKFRSLKSNHLNS
eukprot:CAMPEP_0116917414 /NCGR_PEP_ID=MMETSP0467-20121206/19127_1 /TAXON_ID=283647 /ORGANISM="Mesodinium pulex, Strain SPMC105" /LENGTH=161 /DNA_ID=CAMNT_0004594499 /DNA_START=1017 /DNA_END=1502 /DNA_ORIENTATION=+